MNYTKFTTHRNKKQSFHGRVEGDTWYKPVSGSIHQLRRPPAWAVDISDLNRAERLGATRVEVYDQETKATYSATVEHIRTYGEYLDRGYGKQIALPMRYWAYSSPLATGGISAVKSGKVEHPNVRQLSFEEVLRE